MADPIAALRAAWLRPKQADLVPGKGGVDVLAGEEAGGVVALGDSLTDGNISTIDAFCRWPDQLARRLAQRSGRPIGVMNNGLGGNRILHDLRGDSGLKRFDRNVLSQPGVTSTTGHPTWRPLAHLWRPGRRPVPTWFC